MVKLNISRAKHDFPMKLKNSNSAFTEVIPF